jgi:hypothetical protein
MTAISLLLNSSISKAETQMEILTKASCKLCLTGELPSSDIYRQSLLVGTIPSTFYRLLFFAELTTAPPKGMPGKAKRRR